jgi:hypothetical protein
MSDALQMCACMGPMYDEPYCYCEMQRRGLQLNTEARAEAERQLRESLNRVFGEDPTVK